VIPEGQDYVFSDTLGLIRARDGRYMEKEATREFPDVTRLCCRWIQDHRPAQYTEDFPFTSINVNFNYAARRHRDGNNYGPSMIRAFGKFSGGQLGYFPNDDHSVELDKLPLEDRVEVDLGKGLAQFNGNCAHEVANFEGERYSLVWFTIGKYWKTPDDVKSYLINCGMQWPTEESMNNAIGLLHPPAGYGSTSQATLGTEGAPQKPPILHWSADPQELAEATAEPMPTKQRQPMEVEEADIASEQVKGQAKAKAKGKAKYGIVKDKNQTALEQANGNATLSHGELKPKQKGKAKAKTSVHSTTLESTSTPQKRDADACASMNVDSTVSPAKRAKKERAAGGPGNYKAVEPAFDEAILAKARRKGMEGNLLNLAAREDIKSKGFTGSVLLEALITNKGLVNAAKHTLLSA